MATKTGTFIVWILMLGVFLLACDEVTDLLDVNIKGMVKNDKGEGIEGATVKLFKLSQNNDFVEGGDPTSGEAKIIPEKVASSTNTSATATTGSDGSFLIEGVTADAFLATAGKENCTIDFQGFDAETGALNLDTLIKPDVTSGSTDISLDFVITCADPPDPDSLNDDGSSEDTEPVDPPAPDPPACDETACTDAGGTCEDNTCKLPTCTSDDDCVAASGEEGSFCVDPGTADAECMPPDPNEIIPPAEPTGWSAFKVLDNTGSELLDASAAADDSYALPSSVAAGSIVRVYGEYEGDAKTAYVMVQTGGQTCENFPPKIDFIEVPIIDGKLSGGKGDFIEVYIYGGFMKIQLTTSQTNGEGDRSMLVTYGDECQPPENPLVVILSWNKEEGKQIDIDLHVWNTDGDQCYYGAKSRDWGNLNLDDRVGPGPEVFTGTDADAGPFTIKTRYFSGSGAVDCKVRVIKYSAEDGISDNSFTFTIATPREIAEVGVF